jgi:hypothetical protein
MTARAWAIGSAKAAEPTAAGRNGISTKTITNTFAFKDPSYMK